MINLLKTVLIVMKINVKCAHQILFKVAYQLNYNVIMIVNK